MKRIKVGLLILLVASANFALAQSKNTLSNWKAFIPKGYDTLATAQGDLNKDGKADMALVLYNKKEKETDTIGDINRKLILLVKEGNSWKKVVETNNAILCKNCGGVFGDPFSDISIKNNVLTIYHYGGSAWRWAYTHKFSFRNNDFYLIGRTSLSYWNVEMCEKLNNFLATEYRDENLLTGQYEYRKMDEQQCKWLKKEKGKQQVKPLQRLSNFNINKA